MAGSTFQTNPIDLYRLLDECARGVIQLPDFQRSWVWDEERIKSLIASVSGAFPVGALMSLDTGGPVNFKPRPVEGAPPEARQTAPRSLLLDGQQRMTSLYQATLRGKVVETVTPRKKKVRRWFYIDIQKHSTARLIARPSLLVYPRTKSNEQILVERSFAIFQRRRRNTPPLCIPYARYSIGTSSIPSFYTTENIPLNDLHPDTVSAKRAMRGDSLCSGMVGINS